MTLENFLHHFKNSTAFCGLTVGAGLFAIVAFAGAQAKAQDAGYAPPPMFQDMTPPMVRPETSSGNLVEPKSSGNVMIDKVPMPRPAAIGSRLTATAPSSQNSTTPSTALPPSLAPETSLDDNPPAIPAPVVETAPSTAAPVLKSLAPEVPAATTAPAPPKMMQPIIEERDLALEKKAGNPESKPKPATKPKQDISEKPVEKPIEAIEEIQPVKPEIAPASPPDVKQQETVPANATEKPPEPVEPSVAAAPEPAMAQKPVNNSDDRTQPVKTGRDPHVSAITGPKTMPSIPMQDIDMQDTFKPEPAASETGATIMQRHQEEISAKEKAEKPPAAVAPEPGVVPAELQKGPKGVLKKDVTYQPGQVGLDVAEAKSIAAGISAELNKEDREEWRAQIRSYATTFGNGLSTDRRISLSRALSLRTHLIESGIPASRIDIMAEGLDTGSEKPGDRVEILLFGTSGE